MMRRAPILILLCVTAACGRNAPAPAAATPALPAASTGASAAQVDSIWAAAERAFRSGKWDDALFELERFVLEAQPGDSRLVQARFHIGESHFGKGDQLQAARELRKVSDETPSHPLAPDALLRVGDAYADLWRRPELDPSYGQTALITYQELVSRYPGTPAAARAQARIADLNDQFAAKQYKSAVYYFRLKAYDSAILYLRDLVATYPRAAAAPDALTKLIEAYRILGYAEDVRETCDYLRRFHPAAAGSEDARKNCPAAVATDSVTTPAAPAPANVPPALPAPGDSLRAPADSVPVTPVPADSVTVRPVPADSMPVAPAPADTAAPRGG